MTRTVRSGDVELELGSGTWAARWPVGVTAGPFVARVHVDGGVLRSDSGEGSWRVDAGAGFGRPGAWARWHPKRAGPEISLHVPTAGSAVVVQVAYRVANGGRIERLVPLAGPIDVGGDPRDTRRLVDGYDSWAWSGVRSAGDPGTSWWNAAFVRADEHATLAVQALDAQRFATAVTSHAEDDLLLVEVACGATPSVEPVEGSWGYVVLPPAGLDLPVPAGALERSPPIALDASPDPFGVVEDLVALAGHTSDARRWHGPPITGWESWYHYGLAIDREQLLANARLLRERYRDHPSFDLVQLDDGWQVTYGAWWPNDRFPRDLSELTAELRSLGCRSGLWLAPFMVQPGAPGVATDHPGWMLRDADGSPVVDRLGRFGLDASNPDVLEWLRQLGAQVRAWGFEMVKLDFLYLGAIEGRRHDPRVTGTEALRAGLRAMIDGLGDDVYVLACGAPMLPVVGLAHGNRVGHDLAVPVLLRDFGHPRSEAWTGRQGIVAQARNVAARWALHRRWFDNDPDVVMAWGSELPEGEGGYSLADSRLLAELAARCGGPFFLADDLAALTDAERAVLEDPAIVDRAWNEGVRPEGLFASIERPAAEEYFAPTS